MSTILDALRKVEEDNRTRSADARARLLSFPTRTDVDFSQRRRTPWIVGTGLVVAGFAAGAGLMLLEPRAPAPEGERSASQPPLALSGDKGLQPSAQLPAQPPGAIGETPAASAPTSIEIVVAPQPATPPFPSPSSPTAVPQAIPFPTQTALAEPKSQTPPASVSSKKPSPGVTPSRPGPSALSAFSPQSPAPVLEQFLAGEGAPPAQAPVPPSTGSEEDLRAYASTAFATQLEQLKEAAESARSAAGLSPDFQNDGSLEEESKDSPRPRAARARRAHRASRERTSSDNAPAPRVAARPNTPAVPAPTTSLPPNSSLNFLQWSPDPENRMAFIKVNGGPLTLAHEGDTVGGYTVVEIRRDAVELRSQDRTFMLQAEE